MTFDSGLSSVESSDAISELREIKMHLQKMDRRDRLRTIGGYVKTFISLVWIVIFIWSSYYFMEHSDELIKKITTAAATAAASLAKNNPNMFLSPDQINAMMKDPATQEAVQSILQKMGKNQSSSK